MCEDALWYVVELDFAIPVNFDQGKITLLKSLAVQKQLCAYLILLKKKLQKKLKSSLDNKYELNKSTLYMMYIEIQHLTQIHTIQTTKR